MLRRLHAAASRRRLACRCGLRSCPGRHESLDHRESYDGLSNEARRQCEKRRASPLSRSHEAPVAGRPGNRDAENHQVNSRRTARTHCQHRAAIADRASTGVHVGGDVADHQQVAGEVESAVDAAHRDARRHRHLRQQDRLGQRPAAATAPVQPHLVATLGNGRPAPVSIFCRPPFGGIRLRGCRPTNAAPGEHHPYRGAPRAPSHGRPGA
jgi:hypothetical protein